MYSNICIILTHIIAHWHVCSLIYVPILAADITSLHAIPPLPWNVYTRTVEFNASFRLHPFRLRRLRARLPGKILFRNCFIRGRYCPTLGTVEEHLLWRQICDRVIARLKFEMCLFLSLDNYTNNLGQKKKKTNRQGDAIAYCIYPFYETQPVIIIPTCI